MVLSAIIRDAYIDKKVYSPRETITLQVVIENNGDETGDFKISYGINSPTPSYAPRRGLTPGQTTALKATFAAPAIKGSFYVAVMVAPYDYPATDSRDLPFTVGTTYSVTFSSVPENAEITIS